MTWFCGIALGEGNKMFENEIDIEKLREFLIDYLGSGMIHLSHCEREVGHISPWHPHSHMHGTGVIAMGYLGEVETADPDRLIEIASELEII